MYDLEIVIGSESDYPILTIAGVSEELERLYRDHGITSRISVISCHRNPAELVLFVIGCQAKAIIAGAGKANHLPGSIAAWLKYAKKQIPVLGVAFPGNGEEACSAARLGIKQLPSGCPVEYMGEAENGVIAALTKAKQYILGEKKFTFPEMKEKPPIMGVFTVPKKEGKE